MKKGILLIALNFIFFSCDWKSEYDYRNYLRDKHPYSKIIKIKNIGCWCYQVNDTLKKQIWIYDSGRQQNSVERYLIKN